MYPIDTKRLAMRAKLPAANVFNATGRASSQELVEDMRVVAMVAGKPREVARFLAYMGRSRQASVVYGHIWLHARDGREFSGSGKAGGYGYHKVSEAAAQALSDAGVTLWGCPYSGRDDKPDYKNRAHFGGCGDSATRDALAACARAMGYRGKLYLV